MRKNKLHNIFYIIATIGLFIFISACTENYMPKPHGYFRFDLPEKQYQMFDTLFPYSFEYPVYAKTEKPLNNIEPYWINIIFPAYKATIYLSYKKIKNNLPALLEDTYQLVYKHTVKADAIMEQAYINKQKNVYGFLYELGGNTATAVQFYLTDSIKNFIRGSLYFYAEPNKDSLFPLINYFKEDIKHIMETVEWK
jgi:gliding motility-associated lipoprotein GldD